MYTKINNPLLFANVQKFLVITCFFLLLNACGSSVSEQASRISEFKAEEEEVPCAEFGAEENIEMKKFSFKIISAKKIKAESRLPWIKNSDERNSFQKSGEEALKVHFQLRNNTPVGSRKIYNMALMTKSGDKFYSQPYNSALANKAADFPDTFGKKHSPDTWYDIVSVFPVSHEKLDEPILYFSYITKERNEKGRKVRVLHEHAVADLPEITEGASLRQPGEGMSNDRRKSRRKH
jgi:hypothetical protein